MVGQWAQTIKADARLEDQMIGWSAQIRKPNGQVVSSDENAKLVGRVRLVDQMVRQWAQTKRPNGQAVSSDDQIVGQSTD